MISLQLFPPLDWRYAIKVLCSKIILITYFFSSSAWFSVGVCQMVSHNQIYLKYSLVHLLPLLFLFPSFLMVLVLIMENMKMLPKVKAVENCPQRSVIPSCTPSTVSCPIPQRELTYVFLFFFSSCVSSLQKSVSTFTLFYFPFFLAQKVAYYIYSLTSCFFHLTCSRNHSISVLRDFPHSFLQQHIPPLYVCNSLFSSGILCLRI